ncbi:MAG: hypothetical protein KAS61_03010 [Spirochaetes bacterium]|nr:hypothetical protein [Spirochaetota bacterium]
MLHRNRLLHAIVTALVVLLLSMPAFAHKVNIFAWVEGDTVHTESYFPDGRVVQKGTVSVYDSEDSLLLKGVTDEEGLFSFPVPKGDDLTIVLDASMGHRATYRLSAEELGGKETAAAHGEHSLQNSQRPKDRVPAVKILCGIGYIMSIMGLSMYFYEKRKKKKKGLGSG